MNNDLLRSSTSTSGDTAIIWAVRSGQTYALDELYFQGVRDFDHRNILGSAALHIATSLNDHGTVETLLDFGAAPNITNAAGETPLHLAARHGYVETGGLLLDSGTLLNILDNQGFTPLHRAVERFQLAAVRFLLDSGASTAIPDRRGHTVIITAVLAGLRGRDTNGVLELLAARGLF